MKASLVLLVVSSVLAQAGRLAAEGHLPGDTITNSKGTTLQGNVLNRILGMEKTLAPNCRKVRVAKTAIVGEPRRLGGMMQWTERWTMERCGAEAVYLIRFDFRRAQGTFKIEPPKS